MRPGVNVLSREAPPSRGAPTNTGTAFFAGLTPRGPSNTPVLVRSIGAFVDTFGARTGATAALHDAVDTAFRVGASRIYVSRAVGPAAAVDSIVLQDATPADTLEVSTIGEYDSDLTVEVVEGATVDEYRLIIADGDGNELERSPSLADPAGAVAWGDQSDWVRVAALGGDNPAVAAATPLAGGDDDRANVTDDERGAAIGAFDDDLGPGQVAWPGATTEALHTVLIDHAAARNRFALLDAPDSGTPATLEAAADAQRLATLAPEYGGLFAPWVTVPGVVNATTRTLPPSAIVAGLMAAVDEGGSANVPAAGEAGRVPYALGLSQTFTDAEHEDLNGSGVNILKDVYGGVRLYGYRTLADPEEPAWLGIGNQRLRMQITAEADAIGEQFMFAQIDGRGVTIAEFGGSLTGMLNQFFTSGSLYGNDPGEAFRVDVGPAVNTPETIANGELRAVLSLRMSPFAEMVTIEIVKVPITESV